MMTDPIADMLTRIRNAIMVRHKYALIPSSKMKLAIVKIFKEEGFIRNYDVTRDVPQPMIRVWLKYNEDKESILRGLKRVSKPGCRVYTKKQDIPWVLSGMGIAVLSTPQGIVTDRQARRLGVGGEVLCYIW
jgi:small subunit ribosomal protein S8